MKFLIIRFSSIGDIVLTTPVVRGLKQQLENAEIHYLIKKSYSTIVENNPYVDKVHLLKDDWKQMIQSLKNENFDYIIDLHHNLRTWRIKIALRNITSFSFNKLNYEKWLLTALKINKLPKVHIVNRYMATVSPFGVRNDNKGLDYFIPEKDIVPADHLPLGHRFGYIGLVIGAAHNTKKLPLHKLKELCTKIDHPIILLGGGEDKADGDAIADVNPIKIYNACGKFNINESADLVRKSKLIISHDTGLMHIAAAFRKPILSVWGNTVPEFGMAPYYGKFEIRNSKFEILNLPCRPCSKIGYKKCPLIHFKCMELHSMDTIKEMVEEIMGQ
ncbi:MAG TPA: glycosyltransferase family 9 protein [Chitinophagaceae bacterium]|nr:glycosyltransferase family 9 protein [Chitinophagaceae bacterium]